ncbi:MAG: biotin--[acetyl-CoA-carboxylase] ligase [Fimbriimonadaceae bacterium]
MRIGESWMVVQTVGSTQAEAAKLLVSGDVPDVLLAQHQTNGRGRLGRTWHSERGRSLTMSVIMREYPDHPQPWLIGMTLAIATAQVLGGQLRWPNDVYGQSGKLAGILSEIWPGSDGRKYVVVGVGANLRKMSWPDTVPGEAPKRAWEPQAAGKAIIEAARNLPEPNGWPDIESHWIALDATPGKKYRLPTGEVVEAVAVGESGALLAKLGTRTITVLAAEGYLG